MTETTSNDPETLMKRAAKEERRLLREEQDAERALLDRAQRLAAAEERLARAQARVEKRRAAVAKATEALHDRQRARAAGPAPSAGDGAAPRPAAKVEPIAKAPERDDSTPRRAAAPATSAATSAKRGQKRISPAADGSAG